MPKIKTHRGAAKRFSLTKSGKVKRAKAYKSHILTKKTTIAKCTIISFVFFLSYRRCSSYRLQRF
jgi:hypothetical protein